MLYVQVGIYWVLNGKKRTTEFVSYGWARKTIQMSIKDIFNNIDERTMSDQ